MLFLKFILAMLPIIWLIVALSGLKMAGHKACVIALVITIVLAVGYWKLNFIWTMTAALEGILNALWPICLVIVAALFTYNLTLKTGAMDLIKQMLAGVSCDKRVLALLIGWGFGNFMEGMAGFGTAVAIPASMLAGIGLDPMSAVVGCLVVNSTPTAFGSVGVPTVTLGSVTGLDAIPLAGSVALIQCILTFLSPFLMVCICGKGIKALKGMIPTTLVAALSFTVPWFIAAQVMGPELPDIIGSICSMVCIIIAAKIFNKNPDSEYSIQVSEKKEKTGIALGEGVKAWSPFILIFILLMITSTLCPPIHDAIAGIKSQIVVYAGEGGNTLGFSWVNTPGIMIFIAAIIGGFVQGAKVGEMVTVLLETLKKYWKTILTICSVMATAKIMGYSGMISDIAQLLVVVTGSFYPLFAPLIGAIGAFVTGSGTSTCVLFGGLQSQTAVSLGLNPSWMAAANVMGAGIGKMICPQGIAIGAGAINAVGSESKILSAVFKYCLLYVVVGGIICYVGSLMGL
ncbi:MAG: L-lactate permease [Candidatus Fimousia sp.]|uniref:L-lactate permease n=1 Tax=Anaerostipes sp. 992a TaxID=1261637 RepID=UPI000950DFFC|nr:L-lactate permease [Anaerostipes sp. 992a]MDD5968583.1 L-lactate permease [Anaerostipes sp.]OLR60918.1 lactate permease [Anaerostipes sp. 992a]